MAIEITRKNAKIDIKLADGTVRTLRFDPLSIALYQKLIALSALSDDYQAFFVEFNKESDTLPIRAQMAKLAEVTALANRLAEAFDAAMETAFGAEWVDIRNTSGAIDNTDTISDIMKALMGQIAQAKAKADVMNAAGV